MPNFKILCCICTVALSCSGCAVVSVASAAVSVGSAAVSTAATVVKGTVKAADAIVEKATD